MDDQTFTIIEPMYADWEGFFEEELPEEEVRRTKTILEAAESADDLFPEILSAIDSAVGEDLDPLLGKGWTVFLKATLVTLLIDYLKNHEDDDLSEGELFFPEDLLKGVYQLIKILRNQKTTIENLYFAFEHLNKENKS